MARKLIFLTAMVAMVMLKVSMAQTTHTVGDGLGWTIPSSGASTYSTWASRQSLSVGDTLVFNFNTGAHDVTEVTKTAYDACNPRNPVNTITTGPARITLTTAGEHFYICAFPRHCSLGQKIAINVTGTSTATPPSGAAPTPSRSGSSPAPSSTATPPTTPTAASPGSSTITPTSQSPAGESNPSPPGNSAPSFAAAAFPTTFLSIAIALLY